MILGIVASCLGHQAGDGFAGDILFEAAPGKPGEIPSGAGRGGQVGIGGAGGIREGAQGIVDGVGQAGGEDAFDQRFGHAALEKAMAKQGGACRTERVGGFNDCTGERLVVDESIVREAIERGFDDLGRMPAGGEAPGQFGAGDGPGGQHGNGVGAAAVEGALMPRARGEFRAPGEAGFEAEVMRGDCEQACGDPAANDHRPPRGFVPGRAEHVDWGMGREGVHEADDTAVAGPGRERW